ncbi:hypothetical protein FDUTEX481_00253 [Tolypothrix sp. PCC 7601]|nr:hypothetical protein FDUTEX481_00253 [Tolypothrix sp. PCC 7601]BAY92388.1 hypothetical protein NIES3275_44220 [Microchaete diplosiphon NIES-3275]
MTGFERFLSEFKTPFQVGFQDFCVHRSPVGEGLGVRAETFQPSGFHVKLTQVGIALPLQSVAFFFKIGIPY